mgnify:CR=1 FL=1
MAQRAAFRRGKRTHRARMLEWTELLYYYFTTALARVCARAWQPRSERSGLLAQWLRCRGVWLRLCRIVRRGGRHRERFTLRHQEGRSGVAILELQLCVSERVRG